MTGEVSQEYLAALQRKIDSALRPGTTFTSVSRANWKAPNPTNCGTPALDEVRNVL